MRFVGISPEPQIRNHAAFIWSVADFVVLRRLDCVLEPTKAEVLARHAALKGRVENVAPVLESVAGQQFYNTRLRISPA